MNKDSALLQACSQYLDKFYQQAVANPQGEKALLIADQLAIQIYKLWQQNPRLVAALLALSPDGFSPVTNVALKQASLLLRYAHFAKWPQWLTEQLLAAQVFSLSSAGPLLYKVFAAEALTPDDQAMLIDPWSLCIRQHQPLLRQHWFLTLFAGCSRCIQQLPEWQSPAYATLLSLCYQLALPTLPRKNLQAMGVESGMRKLSSQRLSVQQRAVLSALAQDNNELTQLGRFCSDQIGEVALICETSPKLMGYVIDLQSKKLAANAVELISSHYKLLAPRLCRDWSWLDALASEQAVAVEVTPAPKLSLALLNQLNPMSSITKQLTWFAQHPTLVDFILQVATEHNRQQLPVTDLRHALALLGTDQLPTVVRQAWLASQIRESLQPHQAWFAQWQKTLKNALMIISEQSPRIECKEPIAQLISLSFSLQFQQDEHCRFAPLSRSGRGQASLKQRVQFLCWQDPEFPRLVSHSLASTGLAVTWQDAALSIRHSPEPGARYNQQQHGAMLCQFALLLTEHVFYGETSIEGLLQTSLENATQALDLTPNTLDFWLQKLIEKSNCHWPLFAIL